MHSSQPDPRGSAPRFARLRKLFLPELPLIVLILVGVGLTAWSLMAIRDQTVPSVVVQPLPSVAAQSSETSELAATTSVTASEAAWIDAVMAQSRVRVAPTPTTGEKFGTLEIPALKKTLPIIEGTGDAELKKGVGHFLGSVMPGQPDNCVLSGHRDTVFTGLGELRKGDIFVVTTTAGEFTYKISRTRIVGQNDRTVIVPTDHAVLTVTTCYPFNYVGSAPDRFILSADLVQTR